MTRVPWIEFCESSGWNSLQHFLREDTEELPSNVKGLEDSTIFVAALRNEVLFEFREEFEIEQVIRRQSFLSHDSLHSLNVLADSVTSILKN